MGAERLGKENNEGVRYKVFKGGSRNEGQGLTWKDECETKIWKRKALV